LVVAFANNQFFILALSQTRNIDKYELPRKRSEFSMNKMFLDPTGRHLILNSLQGETFYLFRGSSKPPKLLKKFSSYKLVIQSIAWSRHHLFSNLSAPSTGEFLIGTQSGAILEACLDAEEDFFKSQERFLRKVFTLPDGQAVTGIFFEYFPPSDLRKCWLIITTASRLYQLTGLPERRSGDEIFGPIFAKYKDRAPGMVFIGGPLAELKLVLVLKELPRASMVSRLYVRNARPSRPDSSPSSFVWLIGPFRLSLSRVLILERIQTPAFGARNSISRPHRMTLPRGWSSFPTS
jgi:vacuolar protein sorting-associated protein 18